MGYRIYNFRSGGGGGSYGRKSSADEFEEAAMMAKEGLKMAKEGIEMICEISEEMSEEFGFRERRGGGGQGGNRERGGSSGNRERGGYGNREEWDDMDEYGERRRRDSRGRYM